jgi:hypothetical protein
VPATGDLDLEWGSAPGHARHRFNGGFLSQAFRDLSMQVNLNGTLGTTYGMQTGFTLTKNDALFWISPPPMLNPYC